MMSPISFNVISTLRVILDRCSTDMDDMWSSLDFTIHQPKREPVDSDTTAASITPIKKEWYVG